MIAVIDRFEGSYAVCEKENRQMINIEKPKLPINAREGDVLVIDGDTIHIDYEETQRRKHESLNLARDLWKN